ncbi:hypothetical protein CRG98_025922 [Punica granatum]|uniref:AB hydrolase-1 domain-containing protein n=1 Tax=Punica granatum TaxID=22663 RepID=A0A2I0JBQ2_PUNGR|nr:hypothetical protein CRG98_025922 [Punica granatum]
MLAPIAIAVTVGFIGWAYHSLKPPPPKICGSRNGPQITSPRIKLSDGRHLSYREMGVPKEEAKYKIIVIHGFDISKDITLPVSQQKVRQQGLHECLVRDLIASYGKWEFSPLDVENPFPDGQVSVHIWQSCEDRIIPLKINRYISEKLPWIRYHEIPDRGHLLIFENHFCEAILRALLLE